ncbi:hypothetical protein SMD44_05034 [Streptomyces alboflavus]|uniref:Uncharacterized protein n=1 Tax=Streptomyces alboflavus TaxID=67267 RepID=A0A1Z1WGS3_9ACTN|nr:hypothetical protein SMD44_05034 [Streptomyces alboflavus]
MDQAEAVDVREGLGEARAQDPDRVLGQRATVPHGLGQGGPGRVRRRHPGHPRLRVGVEDGGGPVAADPPGRVDLAPEAGAELLVEGEVRVHDLHRDGTAPGAAAQVDASHAAGAEASEQTVGADDGGFVRFERVHGEGLPQTR